LPRYVINEFRKMAGDPQRKEVMLHLSVTDQSEHCYSEVIHFDGLSANRTSADLSDTENVGSWVHPGMPDG
jgi:hypothetical protein